MTALRWSAATPDDLKALRAFVCCRCVRTGPWESSRVGPIWEHPVELGIQALSPPGGDDEVIWLGYDDAGLGAVAWWWEEDGPGLVNLVVAAVALRLRRQHVGDEVMDEVTRKVAQRAGRAGLDEVHMWGLVHENNRHSVDMCERKRLVPGPAVDRRGYREWSKDIIVADVDVSEGRTDEADSWLR